MSVLDSARKRLEERAKLLGEARNKVAEWTKRRKHRRERYENTKKTIREIESKLLLRERAYQEAKTLIGVMEQGGNNQGAKVTEIIRANGGTGPEPWCGDFVAYCYRKAGSKSVTRRWAAVRLLLPGTGMAPTASPQRGDLVRYTFDHVGMYVRHVDATTIETIEGNTGASGAVSDSSTGGDGVYRKHRSTYLVRDYIRVSA